MNSEKLPTFKYHPNPLKTGSIIPSRNQCACCGQSRGYIYTGPVYAEHEYEDCICPWCIADGSAHERLKCSFVDEEGIGGYGIWDEVPEEIIEEIAYRTPGFTGWQQECWWTHCETGGQFMGRAGAAEVESAGQDAIDAIRASADVEDDDEWDGFFESLDKDASPTAYLFKCPKCGKMGGYQDCD